MRPASEIHSALDLLRSEIDRMKATVDEKKPTDENVVNDLFALHSALRNLCLARDVLAWATGERPPDAGPNLWLVGFLLDDPDKLDNTPPEVN